MYRFLIISLLLLFTNCSREILKYKGHRYQVIKAGKQYWMAENLASDTYRNGKKIPIIKDYSIWPELNSPACGYYKNDSSMLKRYGMVYNWYAINSGELCPIFWRVPTSEDWDKIEKFLGGEMMAGGRMKAKTGWKHFHISADDIGFKALPGGYRLNDDYDAGNSVVWWSSTVAKSKDFGNDELGKSYKGFIQEQKWIYGRRIHYSSSSLMKTLNRPNNGFYIRCLKDF
jgi:uncharacterized protein (TIGR02145 family)